MKPLSKAVNNEIKEILINKPTKQDNSNVLAFTVLIIAVMLAGVLTGCGVINLY